MRVIGTAGHIDHGKSTLVRALTGIDPDRLPEEKARGMTIDLGFAWLDLPGAGTVGVVDVPGHERFVRHMLAGVGGIDMALLVIAADELVMPQTREHLAILDLLGIRHGVVAMTKSDRVDDEWLELAEAEIREALAGTSLADSRIMPCSSVTGLGLEGLRAALDSALADTPARIDRGTPRVPIDRIFSRDGHGTIVTGTLLDGCLVVGQEVALAPSGRRARIRAMQSHNQAVQEAMPGRRIAVNLAGVGVEELHRGMVLCNPGSVRTSRHLDLHLRMVGDRAAHAGQEARASQGLSHNAAVTLHTGTMEVHGRVRLLDADMLVPGQQGWAQIRLEAEIPVLRGDRVILRIPSPARTIAGGVIVAIDPPRRHRGDASALAALSARAVASPAELIEQRLHEGPLPLQEVGRRDDLPPATVRLNMVVLASDGKVAALRGVEVMGSQPSDYWAGTGWLVSAAVRARAAVAAWHRRYPLRQGIGGEELRTQLRIERRPWIELLARWQTEGWLQMRDEWIWLAGHAPLPSVEQEREAELLVDGLRQVGYAPPGQQELPPCDNEVVEWLRDRGEIVRVAPALLMARDAYEAMTTWTLETARQEGQITVVALRDRFATSRKVAVAILEYLDGLGLTRRLGDARVLGPAALRGAGDRSVG